ncbi:MAG TPA: sigma-54 dependent transcriptional regulator [Bacteroidia bacterium]|nr:sigma-54 dependent transcriptional regulator [Bacteroidia bacterium]
MKKILLIEDDITFCRIIEGFLNHAGFETVAAHKVKTGKEALATEEYGLVLADYRLPDGTGLEILEAARHLFPRVPVIIMTSFHDVRTAVQAVRSGALNYITKPVIPEELLLLVQEALAEKPGTAPQKNAAAVEYINGEGPGAKQLNEYIELVAPTDMTVLIQGESGTGKEFVARKIHALSARAHQPFVAIDCGALVHELAGSELFGHIKGAFTGAVQNKKGVFEAANGGTLFLDEIGNLSYDIQVRLLRALQERVVQPVGSTTTVNVDIRIIAATNDNLKESVGQGRFREDLYHRLNEFKLSVPPLRERLGDIATFASYFREMANKELNRKVTGFTGEVMDIFMRYDWPGNLRELKSVVKRSVLLSRQPVAGKETLPEDMELELPPAQDIKSVNEKNEREMIIKALQEVKYNKSKAARLLNIDRKTLYYKMERYGIE